MACTAAPSDDVVDTLLSALAHAESHDQYAAIWLGAECASLMHAALPETQVTRVSKVRERLREQARASGYLSLFETLNGGA